MMRSLHKVVLGLTLLSLAPQTLAKDPPSQNLKIQTPLTKIHADIVKDYPSISHISPAELQTRLSGEDIIILDTRPVREYNVSHIPGALQVDPKIDAQDFKTRFGSRLKDKTVIVYCSVGRRSSILAERLQSTALEVGATGIKNMEGGLFGWHNDARPLANASGPTRDIHPYNVFWGRLIENKNSIRYKAEK